MVPSELNEMQQKFFEAHSQEFDLSENEGCGKYTEAFVRHARSKGFIKVGHLKKNSGQTQWNGHANDAFLYREAADESGKYQAVDIIARAEAKPPYGPNNLPPGFNFGVDSPRYGESDWLAEANSGGGGGVPNPSPFPGYEEIGGDNLSRKTLGRALAFDYQRAKQAMNSGTVVWTYRTLYDAFRDIIVNKKDAQVALQQSVDKHRGEWCAELTNASGTPIPVIPIPVDWVEP